MPQRYEWDCFEEFKQNLLICVHRLDLWFLLGYILVVFFADGLYE